MPSQIFIKENLRIQAYGWPIYIALMLLVNHNIRPEVTASNQLVAFAITLLMFNACIGLFYTLFLKNWIWKSAVLIVVLFFTATELIQHFGASWIRDSTGPITLLPWSQQDEQYYWRMFNRYLGLLMMSAGLVFHIRSVINAHGLKKEAELRHAKELEAKEMEFAFHMVQINPHFLYNVLNGMQQRTKGVLPEVTESLDQLGDLMHYLLTASKDGVKRVLLFREIEAIESYILLERSRFENCYVDLKVIGEPTVHKLVPGTLLTLVENAFKYGIYTDVDHPIEIRLLIEADSLVFECSNTIDRSRKTSASSGLGHKNIIARMDAVFPGRYTFEALEEGDTYMVKMIINQF
jgi:two-component system LytT family sensor kinase